MRDREGLSRRGLLGSAAGLLLAGPASARAKPAAPVLLWLPVVSGPVAPIHIGVARRLADAGFDVITPELPGRKLELDDILGLAARQGPGPAIGVIGYDGGAMTARRLAADPRVLAGVILPGPLMANPVSCAASGGNAPNPRLLEHAGCADIEAGARAALGPGLAWLAAHGVT